LKNEVKYLLKPLQSSQVEKQT